MHILCTICSDLVNQAENINVTKCGHIFHYHCLSQWIERSKSCPQCRNKVTDRCMYRLFPTISNEVTGEDVATLQSRLDDAQLQLRQQKTSFKEHENKAAATELELQKNLALLKASEKKLESRDTAISAMKEQLEYLKIQNKQTERLKDENDSLKKNIQTLNGLQKVLNATSEEVEQMLEGYSDVRTVATFATALKRALCESESKKNESRDRLQAVKQKLAAEKSIVADLQAKLLTAEDKLIMIQRKYNHLKQKRTASDALDKSLVEDSLVLVKKPKPNQELNEAIHIRVTDSCNTSFNTMVDRIENADSPYLRLQHSSLALTALSRTGVPKNTGLADKNLKPSEYALLNSAINVKNKPVVETTSIFQKKEPTKVKLSQENDPSFSAFNISYDGFGGHSKLDTFPVPSPKITFKSHIPKLTAKHKLKKPNQPVGSQDIGKMLKKIRDT